jgi:hypothetical protein
VHGIERSEQPADAIGPRPGRERALKLAQRGGRGVEPVVDIVEYRKSGRIRPKTSPALGVQLEYAEFQGTTPHHMRIMDLAHNERLFG